MWFIHLIILTAFYWLKILLGKEQRKKGSVQNKVMKCHGTIDRTEEVKGINFSSFVCAAQHSERSPVATRCWNSKPLIAGNGLGLFFPQTVSLYLLWMTIFVCVWVCVFVCCVGVFGSPVPAGSIINSADDDKLGCWGQQCECVSPLSFSFSLCHSHTHIQQLYNYHKQIFCRETMLPPSAQKKWSSFHLSSQKSPLR